ncbi:hypothetical protein D3C83_39880 [compost metagenome]
MQRAVARVGDDFPVLQETAMQGDGPRHHRGQRTGVLRGHVIERGRHRFRQLRGGGHDEAVEVERARPVRAVDRDMRQLGAQRGEQVAVALEKLGMGAQPAGDVIIGQGDLGAGGGCAHGCLEGPCGVRVRSGP